MKLIKTKRQILIENCQGKITSWATVNQAQKYILKAMEQYGRQCRRGVIDRITIKK